MKNKGEGRGGEGRIQGMIQGMIQGRMTLQ